MVNSTQRFECIKGQVGNDNVNVIVMQGDIVFFVSNDEGEVIVEGESGWCTGFEICFTPKQFVEHFKTF